MPWFTKKKRQVSAFPAIFKADFGLFRPFSAHFGRIGHRPIQPDSSRISPVRHELKPIWHKSSRVGANQAKSARIREKKKKRRRGPTRRQPHRSPRLASDAGAAPLVPPLCFLDGNSHVHQEVLNPRPFPPPRSLWRKCHWAREHLLSNQAKNKNKNKYKI